VVEGVANSIDESAVDRISAVTALVTQSLLDEGARVMLFTDAANRTSNAIYQALGYYLIDELVDLRFDER
jgi:predicted GNAT family acetyltransferase